MAERRESDAGERTQQPTALRLKEARQRGQTPRSADLTAAAAVLGCAIALSVMGPTLLNEMTKMTATFLDGGAVGVETDGARLAEMAVRATRLSAGIVFGVLIAVAVGVAVVGFVQVGPLLATERIRPSLTRISPGANLGRLFSLRTLVRAVQVGAKLALVAAVGYWAIRPALPVLAAAGGLDARALAGVVGGLLGAVALRIGVGMLAIAGADLLYQRWQHRRDLRMTRREWLDEMKKTEGDGRVRQRRRQVARQLGDWRGVKETPSASLVVYDRRGWVAALRYGPGDEAPTVVAAGRAWAAVRIRRSARQAGVPSAADTRTAQAICRQCNRGDRIPEELYETVARLLARHGPAARASSENDG